MSRFFRRADDSDSDSSESSEEELMSSEDEAPAPTPAAPARPTGMSRFLKGAGGSDSSSSDSESEEDDDDDDAVSQSDTSREDSSEERSHDGGGSVPDHRSRQNEHRQTVVGALPSDRRTVSFNTLAEFVDIPDSEESEDVGLEGEWEEDYSTRFVGYRPGVELVPRRRERSP